MPRDTTILIRLQKDGTVTVDPGPYDECRVLGAPAKDSKACGWTTRKVTWSSSPADLRWEVDFGASSPFTSGSVFRSTGPKGGTIKKKKELPEKEYKYDLSYWVGDERIDVDPKIVIQDSGISLIDVERLVDYARHLGPFAEEAARLAEMARGLSREIRESAEASPPGLASDGAATEGSPPDTREIEASAG